MRVARKSMSDHTLVAVGGTDDDFVLDRKRRCREGHVMPRAAADCARLPFSFVQSPKT
jgi:hypothetical protein